MFDTNNEIIINSPDIIVLFDTVGYSSEIPSDRHLIMNNIYTIQFNTTGQAYPVFAVNDKVPTFYSNTKDIKQGFIAYNATVFNIYDMIGAIKIKDTNQYYLPQIFILFKEDQYIWLGDVYVNTPGFTLLPDQQSIQLISSFVQHKYKVINNRR